MRKYLAFLVLLMLPWVARGQALAEWYYWFDTDAAPREAGTPASRQFQIAADVGHLDWGLHTLYVQVRDTAGVYSAPQGQMFFNIADNMADRLKFHYWFDNDVAMTQHPFGQGSYSIDVTTLIPGFHVINYYVTDEKGTMSDIESMGFFRSPVTSNQKLNYWFEGDTLATQTPYTADGFVIDVTRVQEGFNTIYFQMDDNGPAGMEACHFIKIPQTEGVGDMTLLCIIDGKIAGKEQVSAQGGIVTCDMDVTHMEVGLHKAMFQLITPSGAGSSIAETYFIRTLTNDDVASMQCSYLIDGFNHHTQKGTCTNGAFHFDLPVDEMEDGLHRIDYMLVAENGATTTQGSAWFFKTPLGGNAITQYDYWLNGKNDDVHSVKLDEPTDPFQLVKLLPVTAEPIRSACFHFEVKDGQPKIYAKNDIHFRFHDKSGRWVDADKQYVDYNVSSAVTDIEDLKSTQTFTCPEENGIKWFKFEAAPGDTIGFKSSQATTMQVFAPSGKEVYSASADKSVIWGGCHTWEDGTFYVAVHDVTGTKPNVTLDYMHMDKYDVVAQDVTVVGNGGCSTITFQGNGLRDLYAVDLKDSKGNIIESIDVGHESDATTTVTFDFTGAMLGKYNAVFHFTEEDKTFTNCIMVEEARDIDLETKVSFSSAFLRGTSTSYTVKISNKGNMTAYHVPVEIKLFGVSKLLIDNISIDGMYNNNDLYEDIVNELKENGTYDEFADMLESVKQMSDFVFVHDSIENKDYGMAMLFVNIPPNTTNEYRICVKSNQTINLYAYTPREWHPTMYEPRSRKSRLLIKKASAKDWLCCYKERIECVTDGISNIISWFAPGYGCAASIANTGFKAVFDIGCTEGDGFDKIGNYFKNKGKSLAKDIAMTAISCITKYFDDQIFSLLQDASIAFAIGNMDEYYRILGQIAKLGELCSKTVNNIINGIGTILITPDCVKAYKNKPDCPPNPGGDGGPSTPVNSYDPNEIYGYIAPSGSMFIGEDVVNVSYRIEFENDTTFATTSAHTVVVTDTIDGAKFDLSSFKPTSIMIGDKNVQLKGEKTFVTTIDMRPAINAIAQVEGSYDEEKGIATWQFTSLDPMTMEPTDDVMQGFLPVNYDGLSGIGEVAFDISLRQGHADGTEIPDRASIVFDTNEPILTPTWTNIVDAVAPTSMVSDLIVRNDSICDLSFEGEDNRSGIWKYTLYVQDGLSAPWREVATDIAPDSIYSFKGFDCINYGFCVLATDSAGNVERKELTAEVVKMSMRPGDVNADGDINVIDFTAIANHIMGSTPASFVVKAADVNEDDEINVMDLTGVANLILFGEVSPNRAQANSRMRRVSDQLTLHVSDCEVTAGEEFTVDIHMDGDADFSAFQFDMALPEGFHVKMVDGAPCATLSTERTNTADTDFFVSRLSDDGTLRVVGASTRDARIEGKEGCVAHVTLVADEKAPAGDYEVAVSHIVTAYGGTGISLSSTKFVATVGGSTDMNSLIDGTHGSSLYDMVGKKIRKDHERTGLEKGAYINNGKKVIVK